MVVGLPIGLLLFFNLWSGGEIWEFIEAVAVGASDDRSTQAPPRPAGESDSFEPTDEEIRDALGTSWNCFYDPSMNNNWHDDVVCRNGVESYRPILLADLGFVTEEEMRAAAEAHEAELNSGP